MNEDRWTIAVPSEKEQERAKIRRMLDESAVALNVVSTFGNPDEVDTELARFRALRAQLLAMDGEE